MKLHRIINLFYWLATVVLLILAALVAVSAFNIPGGIKLYTVESGSMEPTIPTGSLVVTLESPDYKTGDVITFKSEKDRNNPSPKNTVTHRIDEVKTTASGIFFVTKGDYNVSADSSSVNKDLVLGKVVFSLPLVGYPVAFARTQNGLILLIIIPATIIIYSELMNIKKEAKRLMSKRKKRKLIMEKAVEEVT